MKLVNQTPLQNEEGEIGIIQRLQGTIRYGFEWYPELEAQKTVIAQLSRVLGKGYTAIRNPRLGGSGITVPLVLVGPPGVYAAHVTHVRGTYQARRDSWGQMFGINYKPANVNLLTRTRLLARALQAFMEWQGVTLPQPVEPIILAAHPGLHVESMQPITRIVLADAVERWAASLEGAAPIFTVETAYELADRIVNPRKPKKKKKPAAARQAPAQPEEERELSRAGAINAAASEAEPVDPDELEFAFAEGEGLEVSPELAESSPAVPAHAQDGAKKLILGMNAPQLALLAGMILVEVCVLVGFALFFFLNT